MKLSDHDHRDGDAKRAPGESAFAIEPTDADDRYHLSNLAIEEFFFDARNQYMAALDVDGIWDGPVVPLLRELLTRFESEASHRDRMSVRSRVVSRSRRSFTMEQELLRDDDVVATCRSVHVCVERATGSAIPVPDDLWRAIEAAG